VLEVLARGASLFGKTPLPPLCEPIPFRAAPRRERVDVKPVCVRGKTWVLALGMTLAEA